MFKHSPVWGIGLDSYGDYYRRMRDASALKIPGIDVVTDAAHNVFIDLLAGGGLILFIPYLLIQIVTLLLSLKVIRQTKDYDFIFASLLIGWLTFLAQSLVSINQIGIGIWGWVFNGLLIGYSINKTNESLKTSFQKPKKSAQDEVLAAGNFVTLVVGFFIGALTIFPLINSEIHWKKTIKKDDVNQIVAAAKQWPETNFRYFQTENIFLRSNMPNNALTTVENHLEFDPDFYDAWKYLYYLTASEKIKERAKENLKRLDPLNPKYIK